VSNRLDIVESVALPDAPLVSDDAEMSVFAVATPA
jgi:hypothetical protein